MLQSLLIVIVPFLCFIQMFLLPSQRTGTHLVTYEVFVASTVWASRDSAQDQQPRDRTRTEKVTTRPRLEKTLQVFGEPARSVYYGNRIVTRDVLDRLSNGFGGER
jgi:phage pi2 protein 07